MNLLDLMVKISVDDQATDKIGAIGGKVKSGLGNAAKIGVAAIGAATAAAAAGAVAMSKSALEAYASYEQLSGGISKLFGAAGMSLEEYAASQNASIDEVKGKFADLEKAESRVFENAQNAYKTTGMSANEYMENVSGFSAALTNSLGGDTVKAAHQADVAMRAISDNVNTFGSDMGSVTMAFQGFAKQNYTMLDNLKLGYGGTKTEMERLIADANEWGAANGQASDLSIESFSDVVTAIQQIQEKQQIAGTTAREAATTIEGSLNMTKAAWQNLLTEFGKDDGQVGARLEELVDSAMTFLTGAIDENGEVLSTGVIGRFETIMSNLTDVLPSVLPKITEAGSAIVLALGSAIGNAAPSLLTAVTSLLRNTADYIKSNQSQIAEGGLEAFLGFVSALAEVTPIVVEALVGLLVELAATIVSHLPDIAASAGELMLGLVEGVANGIAPAMDALNSGVEGLLNAVGSKASAMASAAGRFVSSIPSKIREAAARAVSAAGDMVSRVVSKVREIPSKAASALSGVGSTLVSAGRSLIQGFIDGISSMIDSIRSKLSSVTSMLPSWKGPEVVDRRILFDSGQMVIDGFIRGLESRYDAVRDSLGGLTYGVPNMVPATSYGYAGAAGGDVYNIYMSVDASDGENEMALSFARALETFNMMGGRSTAAVNVRMA